MLIQRTLMTIKHEKIGGLKRAYYTHEHLLKEHFTEAAVLPVPDEAPDELPRIQLSTLREHSRLTISPVVTTFETHYDEGYERNWTLCEEYLLNKRKVVFDFLNTLTNDRYSYLGLVAEILYNEVNEEGGKKLTNILLNADKINNIYDVNIRYTFVEDNNIFVNIMLQNARIFKEGISPDVAGALSLENQAAESIGVTVDINDRYGFNNDPNYHSESSQLNILAEKMGNILNIKLSDLIERGEY